MESEVQSEAQSSEPATSVSGSRNDRMEGNKHFEICNLNSLPITSLRKCVFICLSIHAGTGITGRPLTCETKSRLIIEAFMKRKVLKIMKMRALDQN